jgi:hypothetical protein
VQLDQTRIVIRERNFADLLDLSLRVLVAYLGPLVLCAAGVIAPLALGHWLLLGWMVQGDFDPFAVWRYELLLAQLALIEAPLATALVTLYLGEVMFCQHPTVGGLVRDALRLLPRLFIGQIVLRGVLLAWWLIASIPRGSVFSAAEGMLPLLCLLVVLIRSARPYLVEIILLERTPYRARDRQAMTVTRRSARLHGPYTADLFGRWLTTVPAILLLGWSLVAGAWFGVGTLSNDWRAGPVLVHGVVPACLWLLVLFAAVLRFLSYLDLRIRAEGWEVELRLRAEASRLSRQLTRQAR